MPLRRKADNNTGLGKSIINRKAKEARIDHKSLRYSEDNEKLNSVTHERDLDEFLNSAALADTDFTAERTNIRVISTSGMPSAYQNPYLLTAAQLKDVAKRQREHAGGLRVPRRPEWTRETTRGDLEKRERESFLIWRRGLAELSENNNLLLTPFERNLQVWRQLWRVLERSQLIVQIVDGRNPAIFRCEDLEVYVRELSVDGSREEGERTGKGVRTSLLLINKADLLTRKQRKYWAEYFTQRNVKFAFFSAAKATAEQEEEEKQRRKEMEENEDEDDEDRVVDSDEEEEEAEAQQGDDGDVEGQEEEDEEDYDDFDEEDLTDDEQIDQDLAEKTQIALANSLADAPGPAPKEGAEEGTEGAVVAEEEEEMPPLYVEDSDDEEEEDDITRVLSVAELEDLFERSAPPLEDFATDRNPNPTKLMVGLVGYPNVGKSSTINALIGSKKVSVSSTPGKTKHFQTLPFSDKVTLCDCPGLVFPQFVNTQADMVCDGVLPIDQMREASAPVELLCRRIPREILEGTYGIRIDVREVEDGGTGKVGWEDLLSAYAIARGLTRASFGMPDTSRAARYILKDYVNARLLYCHPPPGMDGDEFMSGSRARSIRLIKEAEAAGKKKAPTTRVAKGADTFVASAPTAEQTAEARERQATSKSVRTSAASAPARTGAAISRALDGSFFTEEGPSARPVAKGVLGAGIAGGYSRTVMYPHTQAVGSDGLPIDVTGRRIDAVAGRDKSKRHFKIMEGKKRSGRGYD